MFSRLCLSFIAFSFVSFNSNADGIVFVPFRNIELPVGTKDMPTSRCYGVNRFVGKDGYVKVVYHCYAVESADLSEDNALEILKWPKESREFQARLNVVVANESDGRIYDQLIRLRKIYDNDVSDHQMDKIRTYLQIEGDIANYANLDTKENKHSKVAIESFIKEMNLHLLRIKEGLVSFGKTEEEVEEAIQKERDDRSRRLRQQKEMAKRKKS